MTATLTTLSELSGIPLRRLESGSLTASDWLSVMAAYHHLAARLDAAEQDKLDALLDRLEARQPLEVLP